MPDRSPRWKLERFDERLDLWILDVAPPDDLVIVVLAWVLGLAEDPFAGMDRVQGFEDYWFGMVPASDDGGGRVVTCSFLVDHKTHTIRCDLFSTSTLLI